MKFLSKELKYLCCLTCEEMSLRGCTSLKTPPKEIVRRGFVATMGYLRRLQMGSVECKRTKLMLVGLGGAGKTRFTDFCSRVCVLFQEFLSLGSKKDNHAFFSTAVGRNCSSRHIPSTTEVSRRVCENLKVTLVIAGGLNPWASCAPCFIYSLPTKL